MMIVMIVVLAVAVTAVCLYAAVSSRAAEKEKMYDAAYKIMKEECLNQSIRVHRPKEGADLKIMLYLKWKDTQKQGYVFHTERAIRIGRNPKVNDICIRENSVSDTHCMLYNHQGQIVLEDLNSKNGTYIRRGLKKQLVQGRQYVYSGDQIVVGSQKISLTIFVFDMAYL